MPRRQRVKKKSRINKEIKNLQRTTHLLIPKKPFQSLVRELSQIYVPRDIEEFKFTAQAMEALQQATETYIVQLFNDSYMSLLLMCIYYLLIDISELSVPLTPNE